MLLNPFYNEGHCAHSRFFCLLWEHQVTWESEIFGEFLTFIKGFGLKKNFFFKLYLGGSDPFVHNWSLEYGKWCLPDQCPSSTNKSWIYCFFVCFKYNNDWPRIHKLHQRKQFQMIFGKQVDNMSKLHNLQGVVIEMTS